MYLTLTEMKKEKKNEDDGGVTRKLYVPDYVSMFKSATMF